MKNKCFHTLEAQKHSLKGLWFFGLSGSGKTTAANYLKKNIFKQSLLLDGDLIREHVSIDLGYELADRTTQINRILGMCKICINSDIFPICSSVYMDKKTINTLNELNIMPIKIERNFDDLKNFEIYKENQNVVGLDLKYESDFQVTTIKNIGKDELFESLRSLIKQAN